LNEPFSLGNHTHKPRRGEENLQGSAGGDPLRFLTFGADENAGRIYSLRFFRNGSSFVDSSPVEARALSLVVLITPAWGAHFGSGNVTGVLLERGVAVGAYFTYDFFEAVVGVSPAFGSAFGHQTIELKVFGAEVERDDYQCRFTSQTDASRMLFSTPSQPLGPGLIHCELPSWGLHYVAEATVVDLLVGGVQVGASNFSNTFTFEPVWTAFSATTLRGAAGGDLVNISAAGLNASGSLERFST